MRHRIEIDERDIIKNQRIFRFNNPAGTSIDLTDNKSISEILIAEGCESFADYIDWLGLGKDPNLIILSSTQHYYYDEDDLKNVSAVVNLKQLNQIKNLDILFKTIFKIIPQKSNFIGCFAEKNRHLEFPLKNSSTSKTSDTNSEALENGIVSRFSFLNLIINIMDSKTSRYMTRRDVYQLLDTHGFKIMDLTELNGLTYFLAQKVRIVLE
jgi:hypothetical protein